MKDKLDGTAQKAKRVAEDEAEYPYTLFLSPRTLLMRPSPRLSLCLSVVSLTTVLVTLRPKRRKYTTKPPPKDESMQVCKYNAKEAAAKGYEKAYEVRETPKRKAQRGSRQRDSRRLLKHGRLLRARRVKLLRDLRGRRGMGAYQGQGP